MMKILITEHQLRLLTENKEKEAIQKMYALCFRQIAKYLNYEKVSYSKWVEAVDAVSPAMETIIHGLHSVYNGSVRRGIDWGNDDLIADDDILIIDNDEIQYLPDNLRHVNGSLDLSYCTSLTSLPNNLTQVNGYLNLFNCTSLTSLPDNLSVGEDLYLDNCTSLTSLPDNLNVDGSLYLENTPLSKKYTKSEIRKMVKEKGGNVGGYIYI